MSAGKAEPVALVIRRNGYFAVKIKLPHPLDLKYLSKFGFDRFDS